MAFGKGQLAFFAFLILLLAPPAAFAASAVYEVECASSVPPQCDFSERNSFDKGFIVCAYADTLPAGAVVSGVAVDSYVDFVQNSGSLMYWWGEQYTGIQLGTYGVPTKGCLASPVEASFSGSGVPYSVGGTNKITIHSNPSLTLAGIIGGAKAGLPEGKYLRVTATYSLPNTPPSATSFTISPASPKDGDTVSCYATITDGEQSSLNYHAYMDKNGASVKESFGTAPSGASTQVISWAISGSSPGDVLKCTMYYNDSIIAPDLFTQTSNTATVAASPAFDCTTVAAGSGACEPLNGDEPLPIPGECAAITPKGEGCCNSASGCKWSAGSCIADGMNTIGAWCENYNDKQSGCQVFESLGAGCSWIPASATCGTAGVGLGTCAGAGNQPPPNEVICSQVDSKVCCDLTAGCYWDSFCRSDDIIGFGLGNVACSDFSYNPTGCTSFGDACEYLAPLCAQPGESCDNEFTCCGGNTCPSGGVCCSDQAGTACSQDAECCGGLSCGGILPYTGGTKCCMPNDAEGCIFNSQCCSNICKNHVCEAAACAVIPTVSSYTDITLDPDNGEISVFVYNLSKEDYIKTPLPDALIFMADLSDKEAISMCYSKAGADGRLPYPYDPQFPGCLDYWFIFCPLSAASGSDAAALKARQTCLNSTGLADSIILPAPTPCLGAPAPAGIKNYPEHILSHNTLYICNKVPRDFAPLCWPLMLILGLLLGASFAVGKNPFAMFDMSSPRLARGRQYYMRTQNKSFDFLTYAMGAVSAAGSIKKDVKSIKEGGALGPLKEPLKQFGVGSKGEKEKALNEKLAPATPKDTFESDKGVGTAVLKQPGVGGLLGPLINSLSGKDGKDAKGDAGAGSTPMVHVVGNASTSAVGKGKKKFKNKNTSAGSGAETTGGNKSSSSKPTTGSTGQGLVSALAFEGMSGQNAWGDVAGLARLKPKDMQASSLDNLILNFSLKDSKGEKLNFGESLLAILKLLLNIVLVNYGTNTDSIKGIFAKGEDGKSSWSGGLKPVVKNIMELVKLLLALYSIVCEISNYSKALKISGQGNKAKGFMDDFSDSTRFKIGNYSMSTNALLSWLDPRMQSAGTGPGAPYPFGFIVSPILGGVNLGLSAVASAIDTAVDRKRYEKDKNAPVEMAVSEDGNFGFVEGKNGIQYYALTDGKWAAFDSSTAAGKELYKDMQEGLPVKESGIPSTSPSFNYPFLADAINGGKVIYGKPVKDANGAAISFDEKPDTDHRRRLATGVELKAEAGEYLLRNFGGMFSDARKVAIKANIDALLLQASAIKDPNASAADLKMAQDYVNTTRSLMGKIGSNETMKDAIDMAYIKKYKEEKDAKEEANLKAESDVKKKAANDKMAKLKEELMSAQPGTHAYNAAKGELMDIESTLALCTMLESVKMPFEKKELKATNKAMQNLFSLQLEATKTFTEAYFGAKDDNAAQAAIAKSFETFAKGFANFTKGGVETPADLQAKVDVMGAQLEAAKDGLPGILQASGGARLQMASSLTKLMNETGERLKAEQDEKAKKLAMEGKAPANKPGLSAEGGDFTASPAAKGAHEASLERLEDAKADEARAKVAFYSQVAEGTLNESLIKSGKNLLEKSAISTEDANDFAKEIKIYQSHARNKDEEIEFRQAIAFPDGKNAPMSISTEGAGIELDKGDVRKLRDSGYLETGNSRMYFDKESEKVFIFEATAPPFPSNTAKPEERFANAEYEINRNLKAAKSVSAPKEITDKMEADMNQALEYCRKDLSEKNLAALEGILLDWQKNTAPMLSSYKKMKK